MNTDFIVIIYVRRDELIGREMFNISGTYLSFASWSFRQTLIWNVLNRFCCRKLRNRSFTPTKTTAEWENLVYTWQRNEYQKEFPKFDLFISWPWTSFSSLTVIHNNFVLYSGHDNYYRCWVTSCLFFFGRSGFKSPPQNWLSTPNLFLIFLSPFK